jgi:hypothetical protein
VHCGVSGASSAMGVWEMVVEVLMNLGPESLMIWWSELEVRREVPGLGGT